MEHPYMPIGEINHAGQKINVINHAIDLLKQYEEDSNVKQAIEILKESFMNK